MLEGDVRAASRPTSRRRARSVSQLISHPDLAATAVPTRTSSGRRCARWRWQGTRRRVHASLGAGQQGRPPPARRLRPRPIPVPARTAPPRVECIPASAGTREGLERLRGWGRFVGPDAASAPVERPAVPSRWLLPAGPGWRSVLIGEARACMIARRAEVRRRREAVGERALAGGPFLGPVGDARNGDPRLRRLGSDQRLWGALS